MRIVLLTTGIVLSLALGLQTHVFGFFETTETAELANFTKEPLPIVKKSIDLKTGIRIKYIETGSPSRRRLFFLHSYIDTSCFCVGCTGIYQFESPYCDKQKNNTKK